MKSEIETICISSEKIEKEEDPPSDSSSVSYHVEEEPEEDDVVDDVFNENEPRELFNKLSRRLSDNGTICLPCSMRLNLKKVDKLDIHKV